MQLKTYLIYCLILYLVLVIRTLLYIEKEKTRRAEKGDRRNRKRENQGEGCRRPIASSSPLLLLRLMPPLSSTSPHLATTSPPIDQQPEGQRLVLSVILPTSPPFCSVCCPHRPHHRQPLIGSHHQQRRGKSGHPARLWVDAITTTSPPHRHRSTSNQTGSAAGCLSSCPPRLSSVPSAVLTVRTIAIRSSGRTTNKGEGRAGTLPGSGWMPSPPPRHRSTSNQKGIASCCLSSCPPRPLPRPLFQVVRVGQTTIHGGPPLPAHPADPLHHAGVCGRIYRKV